MTGRPSIFTEAVAEEICVRIACGESLASICRDDEMPGMRTVMTWLREKPAFQQQYVRAREDQAEADADAISDVGARVLKGEIDPNAARVAIDALKWSAGKRKPKKYGDRVVAEHTGPNGGPIQTVDLTNATDDDLARLEALLGPIAGAAGGAAEADQGGEGEEGAGG